MNTSFKKTTLYKNTISNYFPMHNGILLESVTVDEKTETGIYLPDTIVEQQKNTINDSIAWKVVKVGPEISNVKVGDWVLMGKQTPFGVELDGNLYFQIFENWVVGIFREGAKTEDFKTSKAIVNMTTETSSIK